jgi:hypothetical protein
LGLLLPGSDNKFTSRANIWHRRQGYQRRGLSSLPTLFSSTVTLTETQLPSADTEFWDLTSAGSAPDPESGQTWSNILPFIHIVKLRKLQSKIHRTVFRVDKDILSTESGAERAKLDRKIASICAELDEWAVQMPNPPRDSKCITWMYDPENAYHHDSRDFFTL